MRAPRAAAAALVLALSALACSASRAQPPPAAVAAPSPLPASPVGSPVPDPEPANADALLPGPGRYAALSTPRLVQVWKKPKMAMVPAFLLDVRNPFGEKIPMLVTDTAVDADGRGWYEVLLPIRPNERTGWIRAEDVTLVPENEKIVIDLSERTLTHSVDGKVVDTFSVAIGAPQYPSTTGRFYVWAHVPQASPNGPYGIYALGLTAFSDVLRNWEGGGRMAIHGTPYASNRGQAVSHGCIRVYNPEMRTLKGVPLGAPVRIKQ